MEAYRNLLLLDHLVSHTRIVGIHRIPLILQTPSELPIIQKACNHCPVDGVNAFDQELLPPLLVGRHVWTVDFGCYLHEDIHHVPSDPHDNFVLIIFHDRLIKRIWDFHNGNIVILLCINQRSK
jgi:hypothetical protein